MADAVGFKRITIQGLEADLKPVTGKQYVIEGQTNKGAAGSFEITGLSKEASKVYGSDLVYYVSQKGTGDIVATIGIIDLPFEAESYILGMSTNDDGVLLIGEDTEAPYCSVLIESTTMQGESLGYGLFAGKFSKDAFQGETLTNEAYTPEATSYTFTAVSRIIDDIGMSVGVGVGDSFKALKTLTLGSATPAKLATDTKEKTKD